MNRVMKYVTLKNLVAVSLISCGLLSVLILFTGLVFGSDTLDKLSKSKAELTGEKADPSIVDANDDTDNFSSEKSSADGAASSSNGGTTTSGTSGTSSSAGSTSGTSGTTSSGTKTTGGGSTSSGGSTATASISSFSASPASISYNSASTLSWASANATSCSISTLGTVSTSGTKSTGNLTSTKTYTLTCGTASKNVSVSINNTPVTCGQPNGVCSSAQVAAHASQGDCWMIYNGYYYIVTSYVNNHPGGKGVFNTSSCGRDITGYMNGSASTGGKQHNHNNSSYNVLNSYRVGQVQG